MIALGFSSAAERDGQRKASILKHCRPNEEVATPSQLGPTILHMAPLSRGSYRTAVSSCSLPLDLILFLSVESHLDRMRSEGSIVNWLHHHICPAARTDFDHSAWTALIHAQLMRDHRFQPYSHTAAGGGNGVEQWRVKGGEWREKMMLMLRGEETLSKLRHFLPRVNTLMQQIVESSRVNRSEKKEELASNCKTNGAENCTLLLDHCYSLISHPQYGHPSHELQTESGITSAVQHTPQEAQISETSDDVNSLNTASSRPEENICFDHERASDHDCEKQNCYAKYGCSFTRGLTKEEVEKELGTLKVVSGNRRRKQNLKMCPIRVKEEVKSEVGDDECNMEVLKELRTREEDLFGIKLEPGDSRRASQVRDDAQWTVNGKPIKRDENGNRIIKIRQYQSRGRPKRSEQFKKETTRLRMIKYRKIMTLTEEPEEIISMIPKSFYIPKSLRNPIKDEWDQRNPAGNSCAESVGVKTEPDDSVCTNGDVMVVTDIYSEDDLDVDVTDDATDEDCVIKELSNLDMAIDANLDYASLFVPNEGFLNMGEFKTEPSSNKQYPENYVKEGPIKSVPCRKPRKAVPTKRKSSCQHDKELENLNKKTAKTIDSTCKRLNVCSKRSPRSSKGNHTSSQSERQMSYRSSMSSLNKSKRKRQPNRMLSDFQLSMTFNSPSQSPSKKSKQRLLSMNCNSVLSNILEQRRAKSRSKVMKLR